MNSMKNFIFFIGFICLFTSSCRGQMTEKYVKEFAKQEPKLLAISHYLELNKDTLVKMGCNNHVRGDVVLIDFQSLDRRCYPGYNDTLRNFLELGIFKTVSISSEGLIEYELDFTPASTILSTETSRYYLYSLNNHLPKPYDSWPIQVKLRDHWWYLEYTDSGL